VAIKRAETRYRRNRRREEDAVEKKIYQQGYHAAAVDGEMLKLKAARKTRRLAGATTLPLCERKLVYFGHNTDVDTQLTGREKSAAYSLLPTRHRTTLRDG